MRTKVKKYNKLLFILFLFYFQEERKAKELKFKEMQEQIERDLSYQKNLEEQNEKFLKEQLFKTL